MQTLHAASAPHTKINPAPTKRQALPDNITAGLTPQAGAVFKHLRDIGPLSGLTALSYYGIAHLPRRIFDIRAALAPYGYTVVMTRSVDHPKHPVGIYSLARKDTLQ